MNVGQDSIVPVVRRKAQFLSSAISVAWLAVLVSWLMIVSFVAWNSGLARDGSMTVSSNGSEPVVATIQGEFESALARIEFGWTLLGGIVVAILVWGFALNAIKSKVPKRPYLLLILLGWIPGLVLTVVTMGAMYPVIVASWAAGIISLNLIKYRRWWLRIIELVGFTAISSLWFWLA